jgi:hypothetical protein
MKLKEVPQLTKQPTYHVDTDLWYLFDTIKRYQSEYNLDINPDFQRAHVWTEDKQIAFMEYLFRGGQVSNRLLFNYPRWMSSGSTTDVMVLVDGKQRLEAMNKFKTNKLPIFGHTIDEWEDGEIACRRVQITVFINDLVTRKELLKWYIDLNSGGVVHTNEEIKRVQKMFDEC